MMDRLDDPRLVDALRLIGKGYVMIADVLEGHQADTAGGNREARQIALIQEWGDRGLTQRQASQLCAKHGQRPQIIGAWTNGEWLEIRNDNRRYLTKKAIEWAATSAPGPIGPNRRGRTTATPPPGSRRPDRRSRPAGTRIASLAVTASSRNMASGSQSNTGAGPDQHTLP